MLKNTQYLNWILLKHPCPPLHCIIAVATGIIVIGPTEVSAILTTCPQPWLGLTSPALLPAPHTNPEAKYVRSMGELAMLPAMMCVLHTECIALNQNNEWTKEQNKQNGPDSKNLEACTFWRVSSCQRNMWYCLRKWATSWIIQHWIFLLPAFSSCCLTSVF